MRQVIATDQAPAAIGPYAQAIASGDLVFCSGQIALDPRSGQLVGDGDVGAETRQVLDNLTAVLRAAGCSLGDVVKTTIFLADLADFGTVNAIYAERFGAAPPARSTVQVSGLPKGVRVEIEALARRPR